MVQLQRKIDPENDELNQKFSSSLNELLKIKDKSFEIVIIYYINILFSILKSLKKESFYKIQRVSSFGTFYKIMISSYNKRKMQSLRMT